MNDDLKLTIEHGTLSASAFQWKPSFKGFTTNN